MLFTDRLSQEIKAAMLARNADRLSTLRLLKSAIGYAQIGLKKESLTETEVIPLVQTEIKKRRDAAEQFEQGGRPELAAKERAECVVLEEFLPAPLAQQELVTLIELTIKELGASSKREMGAVIKAVQTKAAGRADGKSISTVVALLLT